MVSGVLFSCVPMCWFHHFSFVKQSEGDDKQQIWRIMCVWSAKDYGQTTRKSYYHVAKVGIARLSHFVSSLLPPPFVFRLDFKNTQMNWKENCVDLTRTFPSLPASTETEVFPDSSLTLFLLLMSLLESVKAYTHPRVSKKGSKSNFTSE